MKILELYNSWGKDPAELEKAKNYIKLNSMFFVISIAIRLFSFHHDGYDIYSARLFDIIISSANLIFIVAIVLAIFCYHNRLNSQVSGEFLSFISDSGEIPTDVKRIIARRIVISSNVITYRQIFNVDKGYVSENEGNKKIKTWDS